MRLIDADKLKVNCVCLNSFCVDGRTIENAPTVEAIPISFIKDCIITADDWTFDKDTLWHLIERWKNNVAKI